MLVANAARALRLSPTGVFIVHELLSGRTPETVERETARRFAGASDLSGDVKRVAEAVAELASPGGGAPLRDLDDPDMSVLRRSLSAPLRAELSLTGGQQGERLLRRLWEVGIPQVVVAVPPNPAEVDLVRMVELAEDLGLIAGLRMRASDAARDGRLTALVGAGLDHLNVFWLGTDPAAHDEVYGAGDNRAVESALQTAKQLALHVVATIPLVDQTLESLDEILSALPHRGIRSAELFGLVSAGIEGALNGPELAQAAVMAEEAADTGDVTTVWAQPVELPEGVSLIEGMRAGPRCSGEASIRLRADGGVVPPTGPNELVGNLLDDDWERIWGHSAFERFRESVEHPVACDVCPGTSICDGGCPKDPSTWARGGAA